MQNGNPFKASHAQPLLAPMGWIYKLTSPSGRAYIGKTQRKAVEIRIKEHCDKTSKCRAIAAAIRKYGIGNFVIEKWEYPNEYLVEYEQLFIMDHGTLAPDGYNLKAAGHDNTQVPEVRRKMGEQPRERWQDPEYRAKSIESIRAAANKRWERPEEREKISRAAKKRYEDPAEREAMSQRSKAMWDEHRAKMTEVLRSNWDDETRQKAAESANRKWETNPELKTHVANKVKDLWADPEYRQRQCAAMTGRTMSEEGRAKMRETRKKMWDALPQERKDELNRLRAEGRRRALAEKRAQVSS